MLLNYAAQEAKRLQDIEAFKSSGSGADNSLAHDEQFLTCGVTKPMC